jgi:single-strand DNA-binding protein
MDYNKAIISGRLTRDPELRTLPSGQHVCEFTVATNRVYTDSAGEKQEETEFHNVVAWARQADTICQ